MTLHAHPGDMALAGGRVPDGLTVALGAAPVGEAVAPRVVRFSGERLGEDDLLVAPDGDDLWRRAPWPAADELFSLPEPEDGAPVLVAGGSEDRRSAVAADARERGLEVQLREALDASSLEAAATVVLLADAGGFPEHAFAVAAAARLLVLEAPRVSFGLRDGGDALIAPDEGRLMDAIDAASKYGSAFAGMRRRARVTAEAHRASEVYARLAIDLGLGVHEVAERARA